MRMLTDAGWMMAGWLRLKLTVICPLNPRCLPVVVFFMLVQHNMVKGITAGATKG